MTDIILTGILKKYLCNVLSRLHLRRFRGFETSLHDQYGQALRAASELQTESSNFLVPLGLQKS